MLLQSTTQIQQPVELDLASSWSLPPASLVLGQHEIHVWRASLDQNISSVRCMQRLLSPDELIRANQFRFEKDHQYFIIARGLLRLILSDYLKMSPDQVCFRYNPYGKPGLIDTLGEDSLNFNISHSGGLALYAVTRGRKIGIDLEHIRMDIDCNQIAAQYFSPREQATFRTITAENMKLRAFFNCWTRKEAYLKAKGNGLSLSLDKFDVSLTPGRPAMLLSSQEGAQEVSRWSFQEIDLGPNFVATVVVEGPDSHFAYWKWPT